jgi:zinc protease
MIQFGSAPERAEELSRVVFEEVARLKSGPVAADEASAARAALFRDFETGMTENGFWLAQLAAYYRQGESPADLVDYPASLDRLAPETIQDAAKQYLNVENYAKVTLLPEKQ